MVDESLTYRGRRITAADLTWLRARIAAEPGLSRRALSFAVCDAWQWRQPNGTPCDAICRGLLLWLHRAGHLELPPARWATRKPWRPRTSAPPVLIDTTPMTGALRAFQPLEIRQVRRTPDEGLCNSLLAQYHYLGYQQPVGAHLKYLVFAADRPVACAMWASAPRHLGPRDRFIGWAPETRRRHLHFLATNTRFLILPWVSVPHLASHVLGRLAARLSTDWQGVYGHPIYFLETFVDPARFRGTSYRAANWIWLGLTTGRGHNAPTKARTQPVKAVLGYPLTPRFRQQLTEGEDGAHRSSDRAAHGRPRAPSRAGPAGAAQRRRLRDAQSRVAHARHRRSPGRAQRGDDRAAAAAALWPHEREDAPGAPTDRRVDRATRRRGAA